MKTNVYCQDWKLGLFKGTKILGWPIGTKHCSVILPQSLITINKLRDEPKKGSCQNK